MRKIALWSLILIMAVSMLAFAAGQRDAAEGDRIEFSYLRPVWGPATYERGSDFEQMMFEKANVNIDVRIVPVFDYEAVFPTMIAGGTMADVMWHAGPQWGVASELIEQGAFLPLNDYLDRYPEVRAAVADGTWDLTRSPDGNNYFFPMPLSPFVPFPIYYRIDVFDELGLSVPQTIDQFVDALKVIRDRRPDLVPLTAHEYSLWYFQNVGPAFGYGFWNWVPDPKNPDRIVPSNITQGHRDFLEWLQMLRREELIDPDYLIATGMLGVDKFTAGRAATMVGHWGGYADWVTELRRNEPDADVGFLPQMQGPAGPMGAVGLNGFDRGFSISSRSADKADGIFRFLSWYYTDGYEFMRWGVEGEMFEYNEQGDRIPILDEDRKPGFKRPNVEPLQFPLKSADVVPHHGQSWRDVYNTLKARGLDDRIDMIRDMFETSAANVFPNYNRMTFSPTEAEIGSQLTAQYITPMQEQIVIDPDAPMSLFDEAIENWLRAGGAQIIQEVNEIQTDKSRPDIQYDYTGPEY